MSLLSSIYSNPIVTQYIALAKKYLGPNSPQSPPALTLGLCIFLTLVYLYSFIQPSILESWPLDPYAIYNLEMSKLTTYPLIHENFIHLIFNIISIYTPLSQFEKSNGTVHTGVVLNFLATLIAIPYCLVGMVCYPNVSVLGCSGWCFAMLTYFTYMRSQVQEFTKLPNTNFEIPTNLTPFILLIIIGIIVPSSSFIGHLFGILAGFLLGFGYLKNFTNPPFKLILKIESKLENLIDLLPDEIHYIKEKDVADLRYKPLDSNISLPLHSNDVFVGTGNVVGSN
ncbi:hypothetical protein CANARDRAFT_30181 [[Candida] arabinofermentans NRRL YB-2248]|uniref:Rhomboid-type serine protease 2 n=1 Tax=[Candida] arabinofermentans NRRL YB-2248 TaxID=983967 RepID=A0A1E4SUY8_9ASCO|nr:hypothetical protein CANARDRAFT_30181 [[Candida] arabinofermentans NRRL YB-2248]